MTRRCSHCSNNGHNSRTCPTRSGGGACGGATNTGGGGVRLFGVRLTDGSFMKKSKSMGNLSHYHSSLSSTSPAANPSSPSSDHLRDGPDGYLSDDPNHASCSSNLRSERKKGKPWSEEEHRLFLIGLQKLGKGDWRGISRNYVPSRTPTQVASHAQKYFIRQSNATRRKRRSSLFDMVPDMVTEEPQAVPEEQLLPPPVEGTETDNTNSLPSTDLSLSREAAEPMEATSIEDHKETGESMVMGMAGNLGPALPAFLLPFPYPQFWAHSAFIQPEVDRKGEPPHNHYHHQVLRPTPVVRKEPVNVDELVGMSRLNLSETENGHILPPKLSLGLLGAPSRQSAFHASAPAVSNGAKLNEGKNSAIQAI